MLWLESNFTTYNHSEPIAWELSRLDASVFCCCFLTQFHGISRDEALLEFPSRQWGFLSYSPIPVWIFSGIVQLSHFVWNFQGWSDKSKNSQDLFQKSMSLTPSLTLFGFLLEWAIPENKQWVWGYAVWGNFIFYWALLWQYEQR